MGGASYRLGIRACAYAGGSLWIAHRVTLYVSCREKSRSMASAPDESGATAELQQLKVHDEDYNPFTEEGIKKKLIFHTRSNFPANGAGIWQATRG